MKDEKSFFLFEDTSESGVFGRWNEWGKFWIRPHQTVPVGERLNYFSLDRKTHQFGREFGNTTKTIFVLALLRRIWMMLRITMYGRVCLGDEVVFFVV